jgi:hypothetical protein
LQEKSEGHLKLKFFAQEELVDFLDNRDHVLREAKKLRKELRALLEDARTRLAELET